MCPLIRGRFTSVAEVARLLRIPGTFNHKSKPPKPVSIVYFNDVRYSLDDFKEYEISNENSYSGGVTKLADLKELTARCDFIRYCDENRQTLLEPLWFAMISNICRLPGGVDLCHELSKGYPQYAIEETNRKILHAMNNSGPHTCEYIRNSGFNCERNCGVKSPVVKLQGYNSGSFNKAQAEIKNTEQTQSSSKIQGEKFDPNENLEDLDIKATIQNGTYEDALRVISQLRLAGEREKYINIVKEKHTTTTKEAIRNDIQHYLKSNHKNEIKKDNENKLSEKEESEALLLLKDDNFLERFLDTTELLGYVGEDENKITLYLTFTSRKLDDPINAIVKGDSSSGKNFNVAGVSQFFPREEVLELTAITPKALYHRKDSLKHKALIIYERSGAEESDYSLRTLQSEKKLIFSTTVKDPTLSLSLVEVRSTR